MKVQFELMGISPLLMHWDNIESADTLAEWRQDTANANVSVKGDDRSPPWTWLSCVYHDGENVVVPYDNIMSCLKTAGSRKIIKRNKTFKEVTQSGLIPSAEFCEFFGKDGRPVPFGSLPAWGDTSLLFPDHCKTADSLGFRLWMKRAKIGQAKHVRVRPRFDVWSVRGALEVVPLPELTKDAITEIFDISGMCGLCDWRPTSPKSPGPFGRFVSKLKFAN